jgi:Fe-S oxidoreductase
MDIIRVFPHRNSYTPTDDMAFFEEPGLFIPKHDEVHVCCVFTWDKERCVWLKRQWEVATDKTVKLGGPAYDDAGGDFIPGMYIKRGIVFTSRGCPNKCGFCAVPIREGALRELPIIEGNIIQDNNFLACSKKHREKAYKMLTTQKQVEFRGGLEAGRLTDWDIEQMRGLRIRKLYFAADSDAAVPTIKKTAARLLAAGYKRDHLHCYVLTGDDMVKNEARLIAVCEAGMMPFAQLYQPIDRPLIEYSREWKRFARLWSRPAFYMSKLNLRHREDNNERTGTD